MGNAEKEGNIGEGGDGERTGMARGEADAANSKAAEV